MPVKLVFPASYLKREKAFLAKHPNLRERYFRTLLLLEQNPLHPSLRLHPLQGPIVGPAFSLDFNAIPHYSGTGAAQERNRLCECG